MQQQQTTADQVLVRKLNKRLLLEALRTTGTLSRARLAAKVGLNRSTVSSIISELLEVNLVRETELQTSKNGRPGMLLELNPAGGCAVGVEISVTYISVVLTDFVANVLWRQRVRTDRADSQSVVVDQAADLAREAIEEGENRGLRPLGIGLGLPGLVDIETGTLAFAPNLGWRDVPLRDAWQERFGLPVFLENDANAGALGEYYFGAARGVNSLVYLSTGSGLGGSMVFGGKLFRGGSGFAGELGHMKISPSTHRCECGQTGCWETVVGKRAILRRMRERLENGEISLITDLLDGDLDALRFRTILHAAQEGDQVALSLFREIGERLGLGVANLINIFNPEMVVLGGALNLACPFLLSTLQETAETNTMAKSFESVRIVPSGHGSTACVMGGVALVLDAILRDPASGQAR